MIKFEKRLNELNRIFSKENPAQMTSAIKSLRNKTPFEGAIGILITYYDNSSNAKINSLIREFMNDLKDMLVRPELMTKISKNYKPETIRMLISSCWQSGLDYSDYVVDFAGYFLSADFNTAFECFTVIEASAAKMTGKDKDKIINMIRECSAGGIDEKTALSLELISVLSRD